MVVISDFQRTGWRPDPDATLPAEVVIETVVIGEEGAANLALTDLELDRESAGNRERVTVSARLINTGAAETTTEVTLAIDDTDIGATTVTAPAGGGRPHRLRPLHAHPPPSPAAKCASRRRPAADSARTTRFTSWPRPAATSRC